ncbi:MAG TPA: farnesyl diphosphate synthase, partial [Limnochordia bacterium]|nr:farnesyl diphosphate synthase [Limnochordia bacterium]
QSARRVEAALERYLPSVSTPPARLHEAMRYSTLGGGKRLRGVFVLAAAALAGAPPAAADAAAAAVEMIHAYSLIHDDLPCMDDDDLRRGKPSCHIAFGEGLAVLAGDALLTRAAELLAELDQLGAEPAAALACARALLNAASSAGMAGGQALDLAAEGAQPTAEALHAIHRWKTGALFRGSLVAGARLGRLADKETDALVRYADAFGLAFQITDDLLDVTGDAAVMGKRTGADAKRGKATFPALYGLERSAALAREQVALALAALSELPPSDETRALAHIVEQLTARRA